MELAANGEVFGGDILILVKDGNSYTHEMIPIMFKTKDKLNEVIAEKIGEGWQVASIGECFGSAVMIVKKQMP